VGFEILAELVGRRAGMAFEAYLAAGVTEPLGMGRTGLGAGASPAWGASGPVEDLGRLAGELLRPRLISSETLERARRVAFPGLAGVVPGVGWFEHCDWGLGFEVRDGKRPHWTGASTSPETFGHFGRSGGFCWVDPVAEVACVGLTDRPFGRWALEAWPRLADAVLAERQG
jgi:CubicO group peptidase (beta-lactamase class C family)